MGTFDREYVQRKLRERISEELEELRKRREMDDVIHRGTNRDDDFWIRLEARSGAHALSLHYEGLCNDYLYYCRQYECDPAKNFDVLESATQKYESALQAWFASNDIFTEDFHHTSPARKLLLDDAKLGYGKDGPQYIHQSRFKRLLKSYTARDALNAAMGALIGAAVGTAATNYLSKLFD